MHFLLTRFHIAWDSFKLTLYLRMEGLEYLTLLLLLHQYWDYKQEPPFPVCVVLRMIEACKASTLTAELCPTPPL